MWATSRRQPTTLVLIPIETEEPSCILLRTTTRVGITSSADAGLQCPWRHRTRPVKAWLILYNIIYNTHNILKPQWPTDIKCWWQDGVLVVLELSVPYYYWQLNNAQLLPLQQLSFFVPSTKIGHFFISFVLYLYLVCRISMNFILHIDSNSIQIKYSYWLLDAEISDGSLKLSLTNIPYFFPAAFRNQNM